MKNYVVIGMNYGDEGKGHITNFLSGDKTLNVRFNGGSQAAHAVCLTNGKSHIFHHFGSGSMSGARTLLAERFIVNPIIFSQEFAELSEKCVMRPVFVDPRCIVTTPWDMLVNTFAAKENGRNDTTGLGINETIERSVFRQLVITMRDIGDKDLSPVLKRIENEWVPYRVKKLGFSRSRFKNYVKKRIEDPGRTTEQYLNVIKFMMHHMFVWPSDNLIDRFLAKAPGRNVVFEGAQGMLLDQNRKQYMPFLTRSNTGFRNVYRLLKTIKTQLDIEVFLVTRTYLTRHGDGPLFNEFKTDMVDASNPHNPYQGDMRFGHFHHPWYNEALKESETWAVPVSVAMTCADQVKPPTIDRVRLLSSGPMEKDIKWIP
jgi:adenylosuccinate synthase